MENPHLLAVYCVHWDSFGPKKKKANLIGTLIHRALEICCSEKLSSEVSKIKNILHQNGYPEVIISGMKKIFKFLNI